MTGEITKEPGSPVSRPPDTCCSASHGHQRLHQGEEGGKHGSGGGTAILSQRISSTVGHVRLDPGSFCPGPFAAVPASEAASEASRAGLRSRVGGVNTLVNVKLSETESGEYVSILDLPGSVLVIPQATLGGKLKGRRMQYHSNIEKEIGMELYSQFVTQCERELTANTKCAEAGVALKHGTYGNRQVLKVDTNGPFSHVIEF